jgi:hypothetical protein
MVARAFASRLTRFSALAAAMVALAARSGSETPSAPPKPSEPAALAHNQIRLSLTESRRLIDWARRFRTCTAKHGINLGEPVAYSHEIVMPLQTKMALDSIARKTSTCGDDLGGPPPRASVQVRPGKVILYLPRQCLLDPNVATGTGAPS